MKYIIKETLRREVEASSKEEVEEKYNNSEIVLGSEDFENVEIYPEGREERILDITTTYCENECDYREACDEDCPLRRIERVLEEN